MSVHPLVVALTMRRHELHLSQNQLAKKAGMSSSGALWHVENGTTGTTLATATKLANAMDCDIVLVPREVAS